MAFKTIKVADISQFANGDKVSLVGKNGFTSKIGTVPAVCTGKATSGSSVILTIDNLQNLFDLNFNKHILAVNDGLSNVSILGETEGSSIAFSQDLSRMYLIGTTLDRITQYILDVPGDVSTARQLNTAFSLAVGGSDPYGATFSTNGRFFFTADLATNALNQWILSNPWEVSTAKLYRNVVFTNNVAGVAFSYDGRNMYLTDTRSNVRQYYMNVPWDIRTATSNVRTLDTSARILNAYGLKFNASGSKLYVINDNSSATITSNAIYQYNLTESWNVSTASYSTYLNLTPQEQNPRDLHLRDSGTKLYIVGEQADRVIEYNLSTADDLSTATYVTNNLNLQTQDIAPRGVALSSDGSSLYAVGANSDMVYRYTLTTPWSTASSYLTNANIAVGIMVGETSPTGIAFSEDGGNAYVVGTTNDAVYQFRLGSTYDLSNIAEIKSLSVSSRELTPQGIAFKNDGSKMFILGQTNVVSTANTVYEYNLSRSWNVQSATFSSSFNISQDNDPRDITFNKDGTRMYIIGRTNDKIYQYDLTIPWAVFSSTFLTGKDLNLAGSGTTSPTGMHMSKNGDSVYVIDSDTDRVYGYSLSIFEDVSSGSYGVTNFNGLRGRDYVSVPVSKTSEGVLNQVGYLDKLEETSVLMSARTSNTVTIPNFNVNNLPDTPFLVRFPQHLDSRYFDARCLYVEGSHKTIQRVFNVSQVSGAYTANLGVKAIGASAVKVYLDNIPTTSFSMTNDNYNVNLTLSSEHSQLKAIVDYYSVPAIEPGDEVLLYDDVKFNITNVSYLTSDAQYNASITSSFVYRIFIDGNIKKNITPGSQIINLSKDIYGTVGNVSTVAKTFTIDYDDTEYTGSFNLANYRVYTTTSGSAFNRISVGPDKTIKNVIPGNYIVKARNTSSYNRASPYTTSTLKVEPIPIGKVENLTITEDIYIDTGQAASIRAIISFTPIDDQLATDYEISYKIVGIQALSDYNTVKVPAAGQVNGTIKYVVYNVNKGLAGETYTMQVRVTPLNGDLRGLSSEVSKVLEGKTSTPSSLETFSVRQFQDSIFFSYRVPTRGDAQQTPRDLDLNYIDIRRMPGAQTIPTATDWSVLSTRLIRAATPSSGVQAPITSFGTFTFLAKTVDTSGLESNTISSAILQVVEPTDISIVRAYDEINPSSNAVSTTVTNNNFFEYFVPSFSNSTNGGLSIAGAGSADNANGTTSGWSQGTDSNLQTLFTTSNLAMYQTKVRSLDSALTGAIKINYVYETFLNKSYNTIKRNIFSGTSQAAESNLNHWANVSVGLSHSLAINRQGKLYAWGDNGSGQLGTDDDISRAFPTKIGDSSWVAVSAGLTHSLAIRSDGCLFAWGANGSSGALGLSETSINRSSPVQVGTSSWIALATGFGSSFAIRHSDRALFSWGGGVWGVLGLGDTISRSSPVQVGTSSWNMVSASAGWPNTAAIRLDGALFTWGDNIHGQLGDESPISIDRSSPVQIGTSSWTMVSIEMLGAIAIRSDGALFTWGKASNGANGDFNPSRSSPVQIGSSSWIFVARGSDMGSAIRSDGALFTWGSGESGRTGHNDTIDRSSPVQVGTSSWSAISTGDSCVMATSAFRLYGWGRNSNNQLGTTDTIPRSSPTIVGSAPFIFRAQGIGTYLLDATYSSVNKTLSNGGASGNVFAIWNTDTAIGNSNSYALIAGVIDDNTVVLSNTYFANGNPTYSNAFPNLTTAFTGAFSLVTLDQYSDYTTVPYSGTSAAITPRLYVRWSDSASAFHANSNLILGNFNSFQEVGAGIVPRATFRHFQLRLELENSDPSGTAAKLTSFNYYLQLTKRSFETTITVSANPVTVDYTSQGFSVIPNLISAVAQNAGFPVIPEVTAASTTSTTVKLYKLDGSLPTGFTVKIRFEGA